MKHSYYKYLLGLLTVLLGNNIYATNYTVSSKTDLQAKYTAALPGDTVIVSNGTYDWGQLVLSNSNGTISSNWIVIKAQTLNGVVFAGSTYMQFGGKRIMITGFKFANGNAGFNDVIQFRSSTSVGNYAQYCRLNNITIINYSSDSTGAAAGLSTASDNKWVSLYGIRNRIDHCTFIDKYNGGATVVVWYDNSNYPQQSTSTFHLIDSNYFNKRSFISGNGGESIRVGVGLTSSTYGYNVVEYNLFENMTQEEPEIISNKSGFNTYRYNTFKNCSGGLTLRRGRYCSVYGNFFLVNKTTLTDDYGIRIIDKGHKVFNNYIEGVNGNKNSLTSMRCPIILYNGTNSVNDTTNPSLVSGYMPGDSCIIAFNTIVNCEGGAGISLGFTDNGSNSFQPLGITITNNLVKMTSGQAAYNPTTNTSLTYTAFGNIYSAPSGRGLTSSTGFSSATLSFGSRVNGILAPPSLVQDAANSTSSYASILNGLDVNGQTRSSIYDVGCDEINATGSVIATPLDSTKVGAGMPLIATIKSFTPSIAYSGTAVTIKGTNFVNVSNVNFGGINATSYTVQNDSTITAVVSSGISGNVSVTANGFISTITGFIFCSPLTSTTNVIICLSQLPYSWNGSRAAAGTYTFTTTNSKGCDSVATLNLTVKNTSTSTTNVSICPSQLPYSWNGSRAVAGTYTFVTTNYQGCDSVATLNLTVKANTTSTINVSICPSQLPYSWNGSRAAAGTYTFTTTNSQGCDSVATLNLTVGLPFTPLVFISTASTTVCSNDVVSFTANGLNSGLAPIYQWKKNGTNAGSGSSITFLSNTLSNGDVISCLLTANNSCQTTATANSNSVVMTIKPSPSVASITNGVSTITSASLCTLGSTYKYYCTTPYGTWSSSNSAVASVIGGSQVGVVTANINGTTTISYNITATNGCLSTSSVLLTVAQQSAPTAITGTNSICVNATTALNSIAPVGTTGVWSSLSDRGIISVGGVYTGKNAGAGEARYAVTNTTTGCKAYVAYAITVNPTPAVPTITYSPGTPNPQAGAPTGGFCLGKIFTVVGTPNVPAGVWSSTGFASITNGGVVTVSGLGTGSIKYTYTSAAGCVNSRTMTGTGYACAARGINVNYNPENINDFSVYPNPSTSSINLQMQRFTPNSYLSVNDIYGKLVQKTQVKDFITNISTEKFSNGIYLIRLIENNSISSQHLITVIK